MSAVVVRSSTTLKSGRLLRVHDEAFARLDELTSVGAWSDRRVARHRCRRSATDGLDERFSPNAGLAKEPAQRSPLDLTMQWHHASNGTASQHHMAATLTDNDEPEALQRTNGLRPRDVREFRQRRRCGTSLQQAAHRAAMGTPRGTAPLLQPGCSRPQPESHLRRWCPSPGSMR